VLLSSAGVANWTASLLQAADNSFLQVCDANDIDDGDETTEA
jgi:hypothetical protein